MTDLWNFPTDAEQKIFDTHHNYVMGLENLSRALSVTAPITQHQINYPKNQVEKKIKLIKATRQILNLEHELAEFDSDFALAFCGWLPAKIYYLLFHCWCLVDYLITTEEGRINSDHQSLWNSINEKIETKRIIFSESVFNDLKTVGDALAHSATSGDNLRKTEDKNELRNIRAPQIHKKLAGYKLEVAKYRNGVNSFKSFKGRKVRIDCCKQKISLLEFFYQYRLKTNYRDLNFLNDSLPSYSAHAFFHSYIKLGKNHYDAVKGLINDLAQIRFGNTIL